MSASRFRTVGGSPAARLAVCQSAGLAIACFLFAELFEGSHPGEAAVAATAVAGTVGPSGGDSLAGEIGSGLTHLRVCAAGAFARFTAR